MLKSLSRRLQQLEEQQGNEQVYIVVLAEGIYKATINGRQLEMTAPEFESWEAETERREPKSEILLIEEDWV